MTSLRDNGIIIVKAAGGGTTTYFYDGNTLTGENRSDGKRLRYFYDTTGLCGFSYFNGSNTKYYTYVKDVLGNIVMIKDDLGLLMTKYSYDEWGNCTVNNLVGTIGNVNPFRYRGYYFDTESGLYYLMSRYYDPEIGQFISMDTVDYLKPDTIGGVDLYAYGLNNPVMYVDPTGHAATVTSFKDKFILNNILYLALEAFGKFIKATTPLVHSFVESFYCNVGGGGGMGIEVEIFSASISLLAAGGVGIEFLPTPEAGYFDKVVVGIGVGDIAGGYGIDEFTPFGEEHSPFVDSEFQDLTIGVGASLFFGGGVYAEFGFNLSKFFRLLEERY